MSTANGTYEGQNGVPGQNERYVPLNDASSSGIHHRSDASSVGSAWAPLDASTQECPTMQEEPVVEQEREQTIQDHLVGAAAGAGTSALSASLDLLKIAGGITLSTMATPLKVTQEVILPALWAAMVDYLRKATPQRLRDWFRMISTSLYHFFTVIRYTDKGEELQSRIGTVVPDVIDCLSSDAMRQVITDSMVSFVKLMEAMHTPEFKSFLEHLNVLGARFVDAAASGRIKQLMNDAKETVWTGVELLSDPSTIVALAEVTATICHTLEMEESLHRRKKENPRRRYERNQFTNQIYTDPDLMQDPDVTVEQVIMSGLGGEANPEGPPRNVAFASSAEFATTSGSVESVSLDDQSRLAGRNQVDSRYLEQKIRKRAEQMDQQRMLQTTITTTADATSVLQMSAVIKQEDTEELTDEIEDLVVETVAEGEEGNDDKSPDTASQRQNTPKTTNTEEKSKHSLLVYDDPQESDQYDIAGADSSPFVPSHIEPDSAVSRFYRSLDEVTANKRAEAIDELAEGDDVGMVKGLTLASRAGKSEMGRESLKRSVTAMRALDIIKGEKGKDKGSLKRSFAALRRAAQDGDANAVNSILGKTKKSLKKNSIPMAILTAIFLCILLVWFGFGCYGMYIFFKSTVGSRIITSGPKTVASETQEIVIRIVKEIVHVNQHGETIEYGGSVEPVLDVQKVAACVAAVVGQPY